VNGATEPAEWRLRAGRYRARLVAPGEIGRRLRSLFVDLHTADSAGTVGCVEVRPNGDRGFIIRSDGRVWYDAVAERDVPDEMVRMLLLAALDEEESLVHIHAGAVGLDGATAILAGWPASGKSTAIVALVSSGFSYVTDERLVISPDGRSVAGFPKPISLITGSFSVLSHLDPRRTGQGTVTDSTWQLPASALGPVAPQEFRSASVLVFIAYRPEVELQVTRVAPDTAAARLLGDSPDVIERGRDGSRAIVSLVTSIPSFNIEYNATNALVSTMRDLLTHPPEFNGENTTEMEGPASSGQAVPPSSDSVDTAGSYAIVEGVTVWIIGDRALAYVHGTGHVVELDEASAVWLQLLDEHHSLHDLVDEVAAATATDRSAVRSTARLQVHSLWSAGVIGPVGADPRG
jgi:hypothetical protein